MNEHPNPLTPLILWTENTLKAVYGFSSDLSSADHLMDLGKDGASRKRGEVLVVQENDEVFLGVRFHHEISQSIAAQSPLLQLNDANLDAFGVVVEEVSHFHLIVQRASADRSVSQLELEWQAEVDKVLVASILLADQSGDPHYEHLMHRFFDTAVIISIDESKRYMDATRHASRFWKTALRKVTHPSKRADRCQRLRRALQQAYRGNWEDKVRIVSDLPHAA